MIVTTAEEEDKGKQHELAARNIGGQGPITLNFIRSLLGVAGYERKRTNFLSVLQSCHSHFSIICTE